MRAEWCGGRDAQLIRAVREGDEKRVRELVAAGAKLCVVDVAGYSALHYASYNCHERIVELLLDGKFEGKGADIDLQTTHDSYSPLVLATICNREGIVRLLLERGADMTLRDRYGRTALSLAKYNPAIRALLGAHGARE